MPGRWGRIQLEAPPRAPVSLQDLGERAPNNEFTAVQHTASLQSGGWCDGLMEVERASISLTLNPGDCRTTGICCKDLPMNSGVAASLSVCLSVRVSVRPSPPLSLSLSLSLSPSCACVMNWNLQVHAQQ